MQQADRHAFIACRFDRFDDLFNLGAVQRDQNIAFGVDPFGHSIAHLPRQQWFGQGEVQVILLEPRFGAHFDHIAKAGGGDKGGFGTAPFNQRIGRKGGAVDDLHDVGGRDASLAANLSHAIDYRVFGGGVCGQNLGRERPAIDL